jgi:hypothetical protein
MTLGRHKFATPVSPFLSHTIALLFLSPSIRVCFAIKTRYFVIRGVSTCACTFTYRHTERIMERERERERERVSEKGRGRGREGESEKRRGYARMRFRVHLSLSPIKWPPCDIIIHRVMQTLTRRGDTFDTSHYIHTRPLPTNARARLHLCMQMQ